MKERKFDESLENQPWLFKPVTIIPTRCPVIRNKALVHYQYSYKMAKNTILRIFIRHFINIPLLYTAEVVEADCLRGTLIITNMWNPFSFTYTPPVEFLGCTTFGLRIKHFLTRHTSIVRIKVMVLIGPTLVQGQLKNLENHTIFWLVGKNSSGDFHTHEMRKDFKSSMPTTDPFFQYKFNRCAVVEIGRAHV